jgi:Flp pilus assembly pilin Flp
MRTTVFALLVDESGQDLIEYALLATALGFAAVAGVSFLSNAMNSSYQSWDNAVQSDPLVVPCMGAGGVLETPPCP